MMRLLFLRLFPLLKFRISGPSMLPTYKQGDRILVCPWMRHIEMNDIIALFAPESDRVMIKRVTKKQGSLFFVEGDNKQESTDSRVFGMIGKDRVLGRVIYRFS